MVGLILPALIGAGLALLWRRPSAASPRIALCWQPVAIAALAFQVLLFEPPLDEQSWALQWGPWLYVASMLVVCAVLVRSALSTANARAAWLLAAAGIGLNVLVVTANGGYMPQSPAARQTITDAPIPTGMLTNIVPLTGESRLPWLADIIPQPRWTPMANVISIGDVLLALGVGWAAFFWARSARRASPTRRTPSH